MILDLSLTYPFSTAKRNIARLNAPSVAANSGLRMRWTRLVFSPVLNGYILTPF